MLFNSLDFAFFLPPLFILTISLLIVLFVCEEWIGRNRNILIERPGETRPRALRLASYVFPHFFIYYFANLQHQFIYFQY